MAILNLNEFFCKILAAISAFGWKIAVVNLNSAEKFYKNSALVVLRRLAAVSVEKPAILEE